MSNLLQKDFFVRLAKTQHKLQLRPTPTLSDREKQDLRRTDLQPLLADIVLAEKLLDNMKGKYPDAALAKVREKINALKRMAVYGG
jgi:hypothetical protein